MALESKTRWSLTAALCFVLACGGSDATRDADSDTSPPSPPETPAQIPTVGGAVNQELAAEGEQLFTSRACFSCHKIGEGDLIGPDLQGVTERRSEAWILAMIQNPDSMVKADSIAKQLFGKYMTPMANQNLSPDEAQALHEFLRTRTGNE